MNQSPTENDLIQPFRLEGLKVGPTLQLRLNTRRIRRMVKLLTWRGWLGTLRMEVMLVMKVKHHQCWQSHGNFHEQEGLHQPFSSPISGSLCGQLTRYLSLCNPTSTATNLPSPVSPCVSPQTWAPMVSCPPNRRTTPATLGGPGKVGQFHHYKLHFHRYESFIVNQRYVMYMYIYIYYVLFQDPQYQSCPGLHLTSCEITPKQELLETKVCASNMNDISNLLRRLGNLQSFHV